MSTKNKKFFSTIFLVTLIFLISVNFVFAENKLTNPLGDGNDDPRLIIGNVIRAVLGIVGSLALVMFIYGGFMWVTSAGNEEKIKKGKDIIIWASFGLVAIFMSYALVTFVITAIAGSGSNVSGSGTPNITGDTTPRT